MTPEKNSERGCAAGSRDHLNFGGLNGNSSKMAKYTNSNLARVLPGTVPIECLKLFSKGGVAIIIIIIYLRVWVSVCLSVCLSARPCSHGRNFEPISTKFGTDVRNLKRKNPFFGGQNPLTVSPIFTQFTPNWHPHNAFQWEPWNASLTSSMDQL